MLGTNAGLTPAWSTLAALAVTGTVAALLLWPRHDGGGAPRADATTAWHLSGRSRSSLTKAA
ncbi:hypothetical protein [Streptomyces sp. NPDC001274]